MRFYIDLVDLQPEEAPPAHHPDFPDSTMSCLEEAGFVTNPLRTDNGRPIRKAHYELDLPDLLSLVDLTKDQHNLTINNFHAPEGYPDPPAFRITLIDWQNLDFN